MLRKKAQPARTPSYTEIIVEITRRRVPTDRHPKRKSARAVCTRTEFYFIPHADNASAFRNSIKKQFQGIFTRPVVHGRVLEEVTCARSGLLTSSTEQLLSNRGELKRFLDSFNNCKLCIEFVCINFFHGKPLEQQNPQNIIYNFFVCF